MKLGWSRQSLLAEHPVGEGLVRRDPHADRVGPGVGGQIAALEELPLAEPEQVGAAQEAVPGDPASGHAAGDLGPWTNHPHLLGVGPQLVELRVERERIPLEASPDLFRHQLVDHPARQRDRAGRDLGPLELHGELGRLADAACVGVGDRRPGLHPPHERQGGTRNRHADPDPRIGLEQLLEGLAAFRVVLELGEGATQRRRELGAGGALVELAVAAEIDLEAQDRHGGVGVDAGQDLGLLESHGLHLYHLRPGAGSDAGQGSQGSGRSAQPGPGPRLGPGARVPAIAPLQLRQGRGLDPIPQKLHVRRVVPHVQDDHPPVPTEHVDGLGRDPPGRAHLGAAEGEIVRVPGNHDPWELTQDRSALVHVEHPAESSPVPSGDVGLPRRDGAGNPGEPRTVPGFEATRDGIEAGAKGAETGGDHDRGSGQQEREQWRHRIDASMVDPPGEVRNRAAATGLRSLSAARTTPIRRAAPPRRRMHRRGPTRTAP